MNSELLKGLIASGHDRNLLAYIVELQNYLADVRNGDYSIETRKQSVQVIEDLLVQKIKIIASKIKEG
jgi:hypothetical protein